MVPVALVAFIVDDSGSMRSWSDPTRKAFNAYVDVLKKTKGAEIRLSVYMLSSQGRDALQANAPIQDAVVLDHNNYDADYNKTPLWITITRVIDAIDAQLRRDGPRKVVVCIQTDGGDPESHWECERLVRARLALGWEFIWMGTGNGPVSLGHGRIATDCMEGARKLGIPEANQIQYGRASDKTLGAFQAAAWNVGAFSSGRQAHASFTDEQRKKIG